MRKIKITIISPITLIIFLTVLQNYHDQQFYHNFLLIVMKIEPIYDSKLLSYSIVYSEADLCSQKCFLTYSLNLSLKVYEANLIYSIALSHTKHHFI